MKPSYQTEFEGSETHSLLTPCYWEKSRIIMSISGKVIDKLVSCPFRLSKRKPCNGRSPRLTIAAGIGTMLYFFYKRMKTIWAMPILAVLAFGN